MFEALAIQGFRVFPHFRLVFDREEVYRPVSAWSEWKPLGGGSEGFVWIVVSDVGLLTLSGDELMCL